MLVIHVSVHGLDCHYVLPGAAQGNILISQMFLKDRQNKFKLENWAGLSHGESWQGKKLVALEWKTPGFWIRILHQANLPLIKGSWSVTESFTMS